MNDAAWAPPLSHQAIAIDGAGGTIDDSFNLIGRAPAMLDRIDRHREALAPRSHTLSHFGKVLQFVLILLVHPTNRIPTSAVLRQLSY